MRRIIFFAFILITSMSCFAQLSGTKSIPGNYATISMAIADLNAQGVGPGGVVFNVAANHKELFSTPMAGYITTQSGSLTSPVTFQKSGTGSDPLITAAAGTGSMDAIIAIAGCDYVTFNGIHVQENINNGSNENLMEWGFAILKSSATNGSQHITIKNCQADLYMYYAATIGIYSNNHTSGSAAQLSVTSAGGSNSNLKIYGNTISGCYTGIFMSGYADAAAPYAYYDQGNEIGKDGANIITNVGGGDSLAYGIYTKYQNNLKVAKNHITSAMEGTKPHYGIFLSTALNASYELDSNYVSMQFSGSGSNALFYPIYCEMGASGTNNTINVHHNTVTGCTYPTTSNSYQYTYYLYLNNMGVTSNVYDNLISNNIVGATDVAANSRIWYLYCNMATTILGTLNMYNNRVTGNSRVQNLHGFGTTNFVGANGTASELNMYGNEITDNVIASNGGTNILYAAINAATKNIYNNTVANINQAEGPVYGLYFSNYSPGISKIYQNKIQNIEGLTEGSNITGIYHTTGNSACYYNNMVSDLRMPFASYNGNFINQLNGIWVNGGSDIGIYNNTVYLAAAGSPGTNFGSSALFIHTGTSVDFRNNILVNISVPSGTGRTVAFRMIGAETVASLSTATNYNDLYAGIPDATHLIFSSYNISNYAYSDDMSLEAYKNRAYPREVQSVTELAPFVNITTTPFDLHLKDNVATQCEAGGSVVSTPVNITTDFDNQARFPNTGYPVNALFNPNAPDIGADEFGGLPDDITAPLISYIPLINTNSGSAKTLTAVITDGSGIPTSGTGLPMLYWKLNNNPYMGVQGTHSTGNSYYFTFGGGAVLGDVVSYYIVAQDLASIPNVSAYPSNGAGGFGYSPPSCSTPPVAPSSYILIPSFSGIYHVGLGKDFVTLTAAATMINSTVLNGPVTLILDDLSYPSEIFPVTFNANAGSSASNTITIKPNTGVSPVISTSAATGVMILNGIDYLIIDGSNNGSNSKNLRIAQTNPTINFCFGIEVTNYGGTDPATNFTLKNCIIQTTPVHSSVILREPVLFSYIGGGYDNCIIDNNTIIGGFDAIRIDGANTAISHNCQITNNIIGSMTDSLSTITRTGIMLEFADNTLISGNDIMGPYTGSLNSGMTGIAIGNGCTNTKIRNNSIREIYNNNPYDGWGACGILYNSDASTVTEITNNLIYDIKGGGSASGLAQTNPYGIFIRSGGNVKIHFNTISLTGPYLSSLYDASAACIAIYHQVTGYNLDIRNNILRNSMECNGGPNTFGKAYGIMLEGSPNMFSNLNYNDYFIDGYQGTIGQQYIQNVAIYDFQTLSSWQAFTGQDANSVTIDPEFISLSNLKPTSATLNNLGTYISTEPADYAQVLRTSPPDIGAYEFGNDPAVLTLAATSLSSGGAVINGSVNPAGNAVATFFDYGKTTSYSNSTPGTPGNIGGSATTGFHSTLSGLNSATLYHYRARTLTTGGLITYGADMTFTTTEGLPEAITVSGTISNDTCFNATQTITVAGTPDTFVVAPTGQVTMIAGQNIIYLPGTTVQPGGYMHGYITTNEQYCFVPANPVVSNFSPDGDNQTAVQEVSKNQQIRIYPNPAGSYFTLECMGNETESIKWVNIFNMNGMNIQSENLSSERTQLIQVGGLRPGVYFIRVETTRGQETLKLIKL